MNVLCTICARKGSKGLKNKNILNFNNKPLISETVFFANRNKKIISKIVVSTDSKKINLIVKNKVDKVFIRSKKLSSSKAGKIPVIRNLLLKSEKFFKQKFDYVIDLDVTNPLRNKNDLKNAFKKILKLNKEVLFSVTKARKSPYFNMVKYNKSEGYNLVIPSKFLRRQDVPIIYDMNASIYIWKRKRLINSDNLYGPTSTIYEMKNISSYDIDNKLDLFINRKIFNEYFRKNKIKK
tara:strand:+ start:1714 stop:2424 length:711 start_codon:yes stop_codon:yes gene_type:complete